MPKTTEVQPNRETTPAPARREQAAGRADYRALDLRGSSMAEQDLDYADFRGSNLQGVNFSGSNLRYADFRGSDVSFANFQNASLYEAKMQGAVTRETDFRRSDLRFANIGGAYDLDRAMMPAAERTESPGAIAFGAEKQPAKSWDEREIDRRKASNQDGNSDNGQQREDRAPEGPDNPREKPRGRGR
jgi:hypothetical protein